MFCSYTSELFTDLANKVLFAINIANEICP